MSKEKKLVLFQGDSITDCGRNREEDTPYNTNMGTGYPSLLTALFRGRNLREEIDFINKGISGNRIVDLYARWKIDGLNLKPDYISILIGVNDTWHEKMQQNGVEPERYETIYRMLLQWTRDVLSETKLILMEPFVLECGVVDKSWIAEIEERQAIVQKLSREFNAIFVPLQDIFDKKACETGGEYWLRDGVHPTLAGHQLIADQWVSCVGEV